MEVISNRLYVHERKINKCHLEMNTGILFLEKFNQQYRHPSFLTLSDNHFDTKAQIYPNTEAWDSYFFKEREQ